MSSFNRNRQRQILTAAVTVAKDDAYSVGDIAHAMLSMMGLLRWPTSFVLEMMSAVIDDMSAEEYADVADIVTTAARAIMAGAARAEDEQGWIGIDNIEVEFA